MNISDLNPGYLSDKLLLREHLFLHGVASNLRRGLNVKSPGVIRWRNFGWALSQRHRLLKCEMELRGIKENSPLRLKANHGKWPEIKTPLSEQIKNLENGRILKPKNAQIFWAQHKYSAMARGIEIYKDIGKYVQSKSGSKDIEYISKLITDLLKNPPEKGLLNNALLHMWGYVSKYIDDRDVNSLSTGSLLKRIQNLSKEHNVNYLLQSTALSELGAWNI